MKCKQEILHGIKVLTRTYEFCVCSDCKKTIQIPSPNFQTIVTKINEKVHKIDISSVIDVYFESPTVFHNELRCYYYTVCIVYVGGNISFKMHIDRLFDILNAKGIIYKINNNRFLLENYKTYRKPRFKKGDIIELSRNFILVI
jgi:hypothetical protein